MASLPVPVDVASPPPKGALPDPPAPVDVPADAVTPLASPPSASYGAGLPADSPARGVLDRVAQSLSSLGLGDVGRRRSLSQATSREGSRRGPRRTSGPVEPVPEAAAPASPQPPHVRAAAPAAVPVFYDTPPATGPAPAPRWGHAAAALHGSVYVIGGVGAAVFDDVAAFDIAAGTWRAVRTGGGGGGGGGRRSAPSDGPGPVFGAAAAAAGDSIFVYGGRQGRTFLRSTHEFRPADGAWRCLPPPASARAPVPPAVAGHTLTACGRHGLLLYGGGGKRVSGGVWRLDPAYGVWHRLWEPGAPGPCGPRPRHGHSAVFAPGGPDRLIIFGGVGADGTAYADAWAFDLGERTWARVDEGGGGSAAAPAAHLPAPSPGGGSSILAALRAATGHAAHPAAHAHPSPTAPCPRFSHCAALLPPGSSAERPASPSAGAPVRPPPQRMFVFGGCTPDGTFLNDAHVLDLSLGVWSPAPPVGPAPAPRYGHSATVVDTGGGGGGGGGEDGPPPAPPAPSRLIMYGGSDARQPFGAVISVVTDFGRELGAAAADLVGSRSGGGGGGGAHPPATPASPPAAAAAPPPAFPQTEDGSIHSIGSADANSGSVRGGQAWLTDALRRRTAAEAHAAAVRAASVAEASARAERGRADALAADLAAARVLLEEREAVAAAAAAAAAAAVAEARSATAAADDRAADAAAAATAARATAASAAAGVEAADRARAAAEAAATEASARADRARADARAAADLVAAARRERDAAREEAAASRAAASRAAAAEGHAKAAAEALVRRLRALEAARPPEPVAAPSPASPPPDLPADPAAAAAALERLAAAARALTTTADTPLPPSASALASTPLPRLRALAAAASAASEALRSAVEARLEAQLAAATAAAATDECKVCMDARPDTVLLPCGHKACARCSASAVGAACPFCRREVREVARLFDA